MNKHILFTMVFLAPFNCFAGGQTKAQFNNMIDLGNGYVVPVSPNGETKITIGEVDVGADLPNGLDCSGIDWKAQLRANIKSDLSLGDAKDMSTAAVAGSVAYLSASLRPTWYESLQNTIKNANKKLQVSKNDCRQIEQNLVKSDPLDLYEQKKKAKAVQAAVASGQTWQNAIANGGDSPSSWSLASTVSNSSMPSSAKLAMNAMLGDVIFKKDGDQKSIKTQAPDAYRLEHAYRLALKDVSSEVFKRFSSGENCSKPLFSDADSQTSIDDFNALMQKAIASKKPNEFAKYDRDMALVVAIKQSLARAKIGSLSCGSIEAWKGYLPVDRAAIAQIVASQATIRGISASIRETEVGLNNLKTTSPDDKKIIDDLSPLPQLKSSFADLKASIDEENKTAVALVRANLHAEKERKQQAAERLKNQQHYKPGYKSPSLFGGQ